MKTILFLLMLILVPVLYAAPASDFYPLPAHSRCDTKTATKGTFFNISTVTAKGVPYNTVRWQAVDNMKASHRVMRSLNTNTSYVTGSEGYEHIRKGVNKIAFSAISSTSRAITVCTERDPGSTLP